MLGDNIKKIRKDKNLSVNNLSKLSGVSLGYMSDLENNNAQNPTMDKLKAIATALNVEVEEFFKSEPLSEEKLKELSETYNKNEGLASESEKIATNLDIIPEEFINPEEARSYISKHKIFSSEGFNVSKLSDDEILEFGNALLEQMKMVSYKYKK
jgi:transcriptional regulator with XRE-family HTH domain